MRLLQSTIIPVLLLRMGNGKKLTCCGDEPYTDYEEKYARDSEWLLHEAFCLYSERDIFDPYEKHHSTVKDGRANYPYK